MSYLKPQTPLKNGEDYIYPITTSDQVVMEDGSRLNAKLENLDVPTLSEHLAEDNMVLSSRQYGASLPSAGTAGRAFFVPDDTLDRVYPVGAIYLSVDATSPASLFGGAWEQIQDRFLLAAGSSYSAGSTGGEASHTLTVDEMPSHSHGFVNQFSNRTIPTTQSGDYHIPITYGNSSDGAAPTNSTGGSQPHNNMPPYLAVYMWKRIA